MFELLFQVLGELAVQFIAEVLVELGIRSVSGPFRRPLNPWLAFLGYCVFGVIVGAFSVWAFPDHFTPNTTWRMVNLIVTPVLVGCCMAAIGAWRLRRGDSLFRIDHFSYGYAFALTLALVRFFFAE